MIHQFRAAGRDARIGRQVAATRRRANLTQAELAGLMGLSHSMLAKLETGARHWSLEAITVADTILGGHGQCSACYWESNGTEFTTGLKHVKLDLSALDTIDRTTLVTLYSMMIERSQRRAA